MGRIWRPQFAEKIGEGSAFGGQDSNLHFFASGEVELNAVAANTDLVDAIITALGWGATVLMQSGGIPNVNGLSGFTTARLVRMVGNVTALVRQDGVPGANYELPDISRALTELLLSSLAISWTPDSGGGIGLGVTLEQLVDRGGRIDPIDFVAGNNAQVVGTFNVAHPDFNVNLITDVNVFVGVYGEFVDQG